MDGGGGGLDPWDDPLLFETSLSQNPKPKIPANCKPHHPWAPNYFIIISIVATQQLSLSRETVSVLALEEYHTCTIFLNVSMYPSAII
jgi:hypothetical protein